MHDPKVLEQFVQLRFLGLSVPKIAKKIGVPASTLYVWDERERPRIQKVRLRRLEEAEESLLGVQSAQFERLAHYLKVIDKQLAAKIADSDAADLTLPELIRAASSLRRQLQTVKSSLLDTLPDTHADPGDHATEHEYPVPLDPKWFAPKQKS